MKIGILGAGAVGLALASYIYEVFPNDIYILAKDKYYDRYKDGIIVNDKTYHINVTNSLVMDYIIISVKNYDLDKALLDLKGFINDNTKILPLLNGIVAHDKIEKYYPNNIVYYGMIRIEANKLSQNKVICSPVTEIAFGNEWNKEITSDLLALKKVFDQSNIVNNIYPDMKRAVWKKWMLNVGINQVSALTGSTYNDMRSEECRNLLSNLMAEVVKIALLEGVNLTMNDHKEFMDDLYTRTSDRVTSLTEDIRNKRKNEVDYFGLTVIELSRKHNIKSPYNEAIYWSLKAITNKF